MGKQIKWYEKKQNTILEIKKQKIPKNNLLLNNVFIKTRCRSKLYIYMEQEYIYLASNLRGNVIDVAEFIINVKTCLQSSDKLPANIRL